VGLGSASGEAVSVGGSDDEASGGHGGEAFVESGGADAAGCAQLGEWPRFIPLSESGCDALIHGSRLGNAISLVMRLVDGLEGKSVVALGQFQTPGMAAAARCSMVRTMRSSASRRR
jgi:hypothetical protein